MSLHANLSHDALEHLRRQQRNSTISSVVLSILVVVLTGVLLGVFLLPDLIEKTRPTIYVTNELIKPPSPQNHPNPTFSPSKPTPPSASMPKTLLAHTSSPLAMPISPLDRISPSLDFGSGDEFGGSWPGDGKSGDGFTTVPPEHQKRCSKQDRLARLQETGGTPECEDAVIKALDWLKANQSADGSWTGSKQAAMTGFALLAYLGHCETPISKDYGDSCLRGITYLVNLGMKNNGKLSTNSANKQWPYEHAIATYALAEATTFCKSLQLNVPHLNEVTLMAGQLIIDNQHSTSGGWDYSYDTYGKRGGDLSITAWQVQALKACQHTKIEFKGLTRCANKAIRYVTSMGCKDGGFAYGKADENPHASGYRTMTGGGLLCLQIWDKGSTSSARAGATYIEKNTRFDYNSEFSDLYGHYYEAQAMINRGGKSWRNYNSLFRDSLIQNQSADGSWPQPGAGKAIRAVAPQFTTNPHYRTCLNTLMLEVYYRFLPGTNSHN